MTTRVRTGVGGRGTMRVPPPANAGNIPVFDNLLWVNILAPGPGTGTVADPFPDVADAVAAVPAGDGATIILAPGDYSGGAPISISNRDINLVCLGGAQTGSRTPPARAVLPAITFAASSPMLFFAEQCDLPSVTVDETVSATLQNCSSVWTDAGDQATVRASGVPEPFNGAPQQTINGSIGSAVLDGMSIQDLTGVDVVSSRGRVIAGGAGVVVDNLVCYEHEFDASVVAQGTSGMFFDQWSLYQALEAGANLGATPPLSVQEESALQFFWGANGWNAGQYMQPFGKFATTAALPTLEWIAAPRQCYGARIHAQVSAALGGDHVFVLHKGATLGTLAPTSFAITILAGQLFADVGFPTPLPIAPGEYMVMVPTGTTALGTAVEVRVFLL